MLIVNADDWGRTRVETDRALECHERGRVTAVSAMVFMADAERAAGLALRHGVDVGLHLNFSQEFDQPDLPGNLQEDQRRLVRFTQRSRFAIMLYSPWLRGAFRRSFLAQWNEFIRLYGTPPSHVDGHQHRHLCANLLLDHFIDPGVRLRRNFTYAEDERGVLNRGYRKLFDQLLARRYRLTDFFFSLGEALESGRVPGVIRAARAGTVELMAHPARQAEYAFLLSDRFAEMTYDVELRSFAGAREPGPILENHSLGQPCRQKLLS